MGEPVLTTESPSQEVHVFVQLTDKAAIEVFAETLESARRGALSIDGPAEPADIAPADFQRMRAEAASQAKQQLVTIDRAQESVESMLQRPEIGARILYRTRRAINGFAVTVTGNKLDALRGLPGVKAVLPLPVHTVENGSSVPFLGVPSGLWDPATGPRFSGLTGTGVRIAIIDSGIDYQHAMFGGTGLLADYQANNRALTNETGAAAFPTAKVVGGWDFAGDAYAYPAAPVPDPDPMDCGGHGTHVAGTAAGYGVTVAGTPFTGPWNGSMPFEGLRIGPGVAPQAQLYALRVFGCSGSTTLTTAAIDWAMDPNDDGDLSDHVDVINMSLGSSSGSPYDATTLASNNAAQAGIIVVASAGNSGEAYYSTGSPGIGERVMAVAATNDALPIVRSSLNGGTNHTAGTGAFGRTLVASGNPLGTLPVVLANDGVSTTSDGCCAGPSYACANNSWAGAPAAYAGKIVVVDRGICGFAQKVLNAQNNGAAGVIIANNQGGTTVAGMAGGGDLIDPFITVPNAMVSQNDGGAIKAAIGAGVTASFLVQDRGTQLASFSALGPRRVSGAKPDIAAPGGMITSAQTGVTCTVFGLCQTSDADGYIPGSVALSIGGTSMAAPHMAGFMALMRQLHPTWSERDLRVMAVNAATVDVFTGLDSSGARASTSRVGGGRVNSAALANASVAATATGSNEAVVMLTSAGESVFDVVRSRTATKSIVVRNREPGTISYRVSYVPTFDAPGVNISFPYGTGVTVGGNAGAPFKFVVSAPSADAMYHARDASIAAVQGGWPRQWITEESGYLVLTPVRGSSPVLRVPVQAVVRPASNMKAARPTLGYPVVLTGTDVETSGGGGLPANGGYDDISLVTALEWQATSPNEDLGTGDAAFEKSLDHADIRYVGVGTDVGQPGGGLVFFGIATWGQWSTPREVQFRVHIDANRDGTTDWVVLNWPNGAGGTSSSPTDSAITAACPPSLSGCITGWADVNGISPGYLNSNLFNSNVMVLPIPLNPSYSSFVATPITGAFNYKVEAYSRDWGTMEFVPPQPEPPAPGVWLTYDPNAPGINFNGGATDGGFAGTPWFSDMNGGRFDYAFNPTNFAANASLGALLLHHHNKLANRAEVLPAPRWISVSDVSVTEPSVATLVKFVLTLSSPATTDTVVTFTTVAGTAGTGDFTPRSSTAIFQPGKTSVTVGIYVKPDTACEGSETFSLKLTGCAKAAIADGVGVATITDNDCED